MSDFGTRLRDLRLRVGMTQADLASASELGQSTISALETGRQAPWPSTRRALSRAFRMSIEGFDEALVTDPGSPISGAPSSGPTPSHDFASIKIMEMLEQLGRAEQQAVHDRILLSSAALMVAADSDLRITAAAGPVCDRWMVRHGSPLGRPLFDLLVECGPELEASLGEVATGAVARLMTRVDAEDGPAMLFADARNDVGGGAIGLTMIVLDLAGRDGTPIA